VTCSIMYFLYILYLKGLCHEINIFWKASVKIKLVPTFYVSADLNLKASLLKIKLNITTIAGFDENTF
jgi:hypothetical protein